MTAAERTLDNLVSVESYPAGAGLYVYNARPVRDTVP